MNDGEVRKRDTVVKEWEKLGGKIDIKKILKIEKKKIPNLNF